MSAVHEAQVHLSKNHSDNSLQCKNDSDNKSIIYETNTAKSNEGGEIRWPEEE
jgi:hypothetical protein